MLKRTVATLSGLLALAGAVVVLSGAPASADCRGRGGFGCSSPDPTPPTTSGQEVTVRVSGSFVSTGSSGSGGSTTVTVPAPCWYTAGMTGKEYYEYVKSGRAASDWRDHEEVGVFTPNPGYQKYKNDTQGHWYGGECDSANYEDQFGNDPNLDGFFTYSNNWFKTHHDVYVPGGQQPPVPALPPAMLAYAAEKAMHIPDPKFAFNPDRPQGAQTVVNIPTWFWLTDRRLQGDVTASIPGQSATVTAKLDTFDVVSDAGDTTGNCEGAGTPWAAGMDPTAASDCSIAFMEPSQGMGLTATASWGLSWTYNGAPQGNLNPITATWNTDISVGQVETYDTQAH